MSTTKKSHVKDGRFEVINPPEVKEVFVDGITHALIGYPLSKIMFHTVTQSNMNDPAVEQRQIVLQLTISTSALIETCNSLLSSIKDNNERIKLSVDQVNQKFFTLLGDG